MKRVYFSLAIIAALLIGYTVSVQSANSKTAEKFGLLGEGNIQSLENLSYETRIKHNLVVDDLDTVFNHLTGLLSDSIAKTKIAGTRLWISGTSVTDSLSVSDGVNVGDELTADSINVVDLKVSGAAIIDSANVTLSILDSAVITDATITDAVITTAIIDSAACTDVTVSNVLNVALTGIFDSLSVKDGMNIADELTLDSLNVADAVISNKLYITKTAIIDSAAITDATISNIIDIDGICRADSLRIDASVQNFEAAVDSATKYLQLDINGTTYKVLLLP